MLAAIRHSSSDLLKLAETEGLSEETVALLKILAMGERDVEQGKLRPLAEVVERIRSRPVHKTG